MQRANHTVPALLASLALFGGLCLGRAAVADPEREGFDLSSQSLAVGDPVGRAIFERDGKHVIVPPKALQERAEKRVAPATATQPALPAWPAKWGGDSDLSEGSTY